MFKPFSMVHEGKGQFATFSPTNDPDTVFIQFKGSCGSIMENYITREIMTAALADLFAKGYKEVPT
jgi:Fe-S cluster biogenesis protein NfuA